MFVWGGLCLLEERIALPLIGWVWGEREENNRK